MGRVKPRKLRSEHEKERSVARALQGLKSVQYPSIRNAANIGSVAYTTLHRQLHAGQGSGGGHEVQHLVTAAQERAIVRWIYRLELPGFPPRIEEAVMILQDELDDLDAVISY